MLVYVALLPLAGERLLHGEGRLGIVSHGRDTTRRGNTPHLQVLELALDFLGPTFQLVDLVPPLRGHWKRPRNRRLHPLFVLNRLVRLHLLLLILLDLLLLLLLIGGGLGPVRVHRRSLPFDRVVDDLRLFEAFK